MTNSDLTLVSAGTARPAAGGAAAARARPPVRIGSRAGDPPFDWTDRASWPGSLAGVTTAYLTYQPDLAFPARPRPSATTPALAAAGGVRRLVLLSGRGEDGALAGEKAVAAAGVEWTVVRSAFFMQNFTEDFLAGAIEAGEFALPAGDVPEPFVDAEDIADVALAALLGSVPLDRVYEVTGPRALTFGEVAAEIAAASGRPVRYLPVTVDEFVAGAVAAGYPAEVAAGLGEVFGAVLDGRNVATAGGVAEALGRPPRDFTEFAAAAWGPR
jgi:uncharacterized protein YbjT (DUF2867 family)